METTETKQKQRRLKKYKRDPEGFGPMRLTARDYEILELLLRHRHLEAHHLQALLNLQRRSGVDRQISRRLQGLFHHGFVGRYWPGARMRMEPGSRRPVYGLDRKGAEYLCDWMSERDGRAYTLPTRGEKRDSDIWWRAEHYRRMETKLLHEVMVSETIVALELATQAAAGYHIEDCLLSGDCYGEVRVDGEGTFRIMPDAYVLLNEHETLRNTFWEMDRASEESRWIIRKYRAYVEYLRSEDYRRYPNHQNVRVLFVTTSEARLANMMALVRKLGLARRETALFWFTLDNRFAVETPETILFEPIWQTLTMPEKRLSLARPQQAPAEEE